MVFPEATKLLPLFSLSNFVASYGIHGGMSELQTAALTIFRVVKLWLFLGVGMQTTGRTPRCGLSSVSSLTRYRKNKGDSVGGQGVAACEHNLP
jgi:hypothetical protein